MSLQEIEMNGGVVSAMHQEFGNNEAAPVGEKEETREIATANASEKATEWIINNTVEEIKYKANWFNEDHCRLTVQ